MVRFRRGLAILGVLLTAAVAVAIRTRQPASQPRPAPARHAVFVQDAYMGVACHIANSIACNRVGLAVWLARPATVTATIEGASCRLDDPTWSHATHEGGKPLYVYAGLPLARRAHHPPARGAGRAINLVWRGPR
jgi:hypothetical protein